MAEATLRGKVEVPEGCQFSQSGIIITVKGPKGELTRKLPDKWIKLNHEGQKLELWYEKTTKNQKKQLFTTVSHIKNMMIGVTDGYVYKLKICSGHFPMNVSLKNNVLEVKNFIGEAVPRKLTIKEGSDVKVQGDIITVESIDKEKAGQTAGSIEKLTKRPGFDKRIFQDGIYITEKAGKKI